MVSLILCLFQRDEQAVQADAEVSSSKKNKDDLNTDDLSGIVFELKMDLAGIISFLDVPFILVRIFYRGLYVYIMRMRSSLVVRASDCQCTSCNGPGFDPSIRRHSGIWGAADEAVLNIVRTKRKKIPPQKNKKTLCPEMEKLTKDLFSEKDNKIAELEKKLRKVRDFYQGVNIFKFNLLQRLLTYNYSSLIYFLHTFPNLFRP